jgi:hypothetical protein
MAKTGRFFVLISITAAAGCVGGAPNGQANATLCATNHDCSKPMACMQGFCQMPDTMPWTQVTDAGVVQAGPEAGSVGTTVVPSVLCKSCTSNTDCGGNNLCIVDNSSANSPAFCGLDCSSTSCPSGTQCYQITDATNNVVGSACYPSSCIGFGGVGACYSKTQCPLGTTCTGQKCVGTTSGPLPDSGVILPKPDAMVIVGGCGTGPACVSPQTCKNGVCVNPPPPPDMGSSTGPCQGLTWNNFALNYMNNYCDGCHGSMGSYSGTKNDSSRIQRYIQDGSMPPSDQPQPSTTENNNIITWLTCGMPQ